MTEITDPGRESVGGHEGVSYPVVAVNGRVAVIAGMRMATHEIVTYTESLNLIEH